MRRLMVAVGLVVASVVLSADTLVLRDGRRVQGTLVSADDESLDFEERSGGRRVVRTYDKSDVLRIEFDRQGGFFDDPGGSGGRPTGLREKLVIVNADTDWTDAGITVRVGQDI